MPAVLDRLRAIDPEQSSDKARIRHLLGVEHFVHLRRADMVAQAVSLVLAEQTGLWHKNTDGSAREIAPGGGEPLYDQHRIAAQLQKLKGEANGWETWFGSQTITPIRLAYEDLAADPAKALQDVMHAVGRPVSRPLPEPGTARLATHINDDWASRFRCETGT